MLISSLLYICNWLLPALHGTIKTARIVHVYSFIFLLHFARLSIDVLCWASSVTQLGLTYAMHMTATHKTHKTVWRLNSCLVGCFPFFVVAHIAHAKLAHEDRKRKILHKKKNEAAECAIIHCFGCKKRFKLYWNWGVGEHFQMQHKTLLSNNRFSLIYIFSIYMYIVRFNIPN